MTRFAVAALICCAWPMFAADMSGSCRETMRGDGTLQTTESRRGRDRAKFHITGERRGDNTHGRLEFRDREQGVSLSSRNLTNYEVVDENTRRLTFDLGGEGEEPNLVVVTLRDLGKRGKTDFFELSAGEYLASGNLRGGNVRLKSRGCNDVIVDE